MGDVAGQIIIAVFLYVKAFAGVTVLKQVRPAQDEVCLALFVGVPGDVDGRWEFNYDDGFIRFRIGAKNGIDRESSFPISDFPCSS